MSDPVDIPEPRPPSTKGTRQIIRAVLDYGPSPQWHKHQMREFKQAWPTMARAVVQLLLDNNHQPPKELL